MKKRKYHRKQKEIGERKVDNWRKDIQKIERERETQREKEKEVEKGIKKLEDRQIKK